MIIITANDIGITSSSYLYISSSGYSEHREVFLFALQYSYCLVVFIIPVLMLFMFVSLWHSWYLHSWFLL